MTTTMVAMTSSTTDRLRSDFDFLVGSWDVAHRRLRAPLTGSPDDWYSFTGTCAARTYLDGAVSFDEIAIPDHGLSGASLRLRDPSTGEWSIYWLNSRDGVVQPPVQGAWSDGGCRLLGDDVHDGAPIRVTYEWSDIGEQTARWQQAYSADGEQSWETNWVMDFRRTAQEPVDVGNEHLPKVTGDFDFLTGDWRVTNRRLNERLVGCTEWTEFEHTLRGRTHFNGGISVDENVLPNLYTGLTVRVYDVAAGEWAIYWIDSRAPELGEPVRGKFQDGVGEFFCEEVQEGRPVVVRFRWTVLDDENATWEQAFSTDDGTTWETNWTTTHTRVG